MGRPKTSPTPDGRQRCRQCRINKPVADFERRTCRESGISASCLDCLTADRDTAVYLQQMMDDGYRRQYAPTPAQPTKAPLEAHTPLEVVTDEHFRHVDAERRHERLRR